MTAEELFKELGFEKTHESNYSITFTSKNIVTTDMITFYNKDQSVIAVEYSIYGDEYGRPMEITLEINRAITKQMKELGWM